MASSMASGAARALSTRALDRTEAYQAPMALGGLFAIVTGVVTFGVAMGTGASAGLAASTALVNFGVMGLFGCVLARHSAAFGAILAGVAGLALAAFGGGAGLLAGVLLTSGAVWAAVARRWTLPADAPPASLHG